MGGKGDKRLVTTVAFLIIIGGLSVGTIIQFSVNSIDKLMRQKETSIGVEMGGIKSEGNGSKIRSLIIKFDKMYNDSVIGHDKLIGVYGMMQKILNKEIIEDADQEKTIYKDQDDGLHFIEKEKDVSYCATSLLGLKQKLDRLNIPLVYIQPPSKVEEGVTKLPEGVYDYSNKNIDKFLDSISGDVECLDLRHRNLSFYKTDHHWTVESAFKASKGIINLIKQNKGIGVTIPNEDEIFSNFKTQVYKENFLGSLGVRVSSNYVDADDFTMITPCFDTAFTIKQISNGELLHERNGSFEQTLIYDSMLHSDEKYSIESYTAYLGYGNTEKKITNHRIDNSYKLLVIGDSFSRPVTTFLSFFFKETRNIDTQEGRFNENVYKYIEEYNPDMVIVLFSASSLGNNTTFNFNK